MTAQLCMPPSTLIMIVDDDRITRRALALVLTSYGFGVKEASTGMEALQQLEHTPADLILLDLCMPGIDGFETCRRLRAMPQFRMLPVLMLTGLEDIDAIEQAFDAGATDFITKPVNMPLVGERVRYAIRTYKMTEELAFNRQLLSHAHQLSGLGHWQFDLCHQVIELSVEAKKIFGITTASNTITYEALLKLLNSDSQVVIEQMLTQMENGEASTSIELSLHHSEQPNRHLRIHSEPMGNSVNEKPHLLLGTILDITEEHRKEALIKHQTLHDELTALPNRRLFTAHLSQAIATAKNSTQLLGLLFINLNRFKVINETLGHTLGDTLLKMVAKRLLSCAGATGTVARLNGDEFTVLLPRIENSDEITVAAETIFEALSESFHLLEKEVVISPSIGISLYPQDGTETDSLIRNAEMAMSQAKAHGGQRYKFSDVALNTATTARLSLEGALRRALEQDELRLHYQPQINLQSMSVVSVEALARWQSDKLGNIPPARFIPVAEESGLIHQLGEWVLHTACASVAAWHARGITSLRVAVNISPKQFRRGNLVKQIENTLSTTGLDAKYLVIEVTESLAMADVAHSEKVLSQLRDQGIRIAIDDFATGHSSLHHLQRYPADELKIDRSFINGVGSSPTDTAIVKTVISLSHNLGLEALAEGVETLEQCAFLKQNGCDLIQGYFFSPPVAADELLPLLMHQDSALSNSLAQTNALVM